MKKSITPKQVTKDQLVEYRNLVIWILNKKANYRGYLNLNDAMTTILNKVENGEVTYKTVRGIKGVLCNLALSVGLQNSEDNLRKQNDISVLAGAYDHPYINNFQQFRLNALM